MITLRSMIQSIAVASFVVAVTLIVLALTATRWDLEPLVAMSAGVAVIVGNLAFEHSRSMLSRISERKRKGASRLDAVVCVLALALAIAAIRPDARDGAFTLPEQYRINLSRLP